MADSEEKSTRKSSKSQPVAEVNESELHRPIREVVIDGFVALKIVKHCNDFSPSKVSGSLLGVDRDGVLQISYAFPFVQPDQIDDDFDSSKYLSDMMTKLEAVNVANYCCGWYQTTHLGSFFTADSVSIQHSYHTSEDIASGDAIMIIHDPFQSKHGRLVLKAYRLSSKYLEMRRNKQHGFLAPQEILEEIPMKIRTAGHAASFLRTLSESPKLSGEAAFSSLSLSGSEVYSEVSLEGLSQTLDDLLAEHQRFLMHAKTLNKGRQDQSRGGKKQFSEADRSEAPSRLDSLMHMGQLTLNCEQLQEQTEAAREKLQTSALLSAAP